MYRTELYCHLVQLFCAWFVLQRHNLVRLGHVHFLMTSDACTTTMLLALYAVRCRPSGALRVETYFTQNDSLRTRHVLYQQLVLDELVLRKRFESSWRRNDKSLSTQRTRLLIS